MRAWMRLCACRSRRRANQCANISVWRISGMADVSYRIQKLKVKSPKDIALVKVGINSASIGRSWQSIDGSTGYGKVLAESGNIVPRSRPRVWNAERSEQGT